jgi:hypothetical protein
METYIQAKFRGAFCSSILETPTRIKNKKRRTVRVRSKRNDEYNYNLTNGNDNYSTHEMVNENLSSSIYATICN